MDHAGPVGRRERLGDLAQQPHRLGHRQLAAAGQAVAQGLALDVGHHVVEEAVGVAGVEQAQDVGMLQPGGDLDLAGEPLGAERGGQLGAQDLHRHLAVVLQVLGEVDRGHAALAELALDAVAVGEGRLQSGHRLGHRWALRGSGWKMEGNAPAGQRAGRNHSRQSSV